MQEPSTAPLGAKAGTRTTVVTTGALLAVVLAVQFFQLSLAPTRTFDPDEFQHAHSAFAISQGQTPYLDYFEHHPPLLHLILAPLLGALHPERGSREAFQALLLLRTIGWSVAMVGGLAHFLLARRLLGGVGGAVASLLLWSTLVVFETSIEIRPDTFAFALLQIALLLLSRSRSRRSMGWSFLLLGIGMLFTQKLAFPVLGVVLWLVATRTKAGKFGDLALAAITLMTPTLICIAWFHQKGAAGDFIEDVFLINLRWKARLPAASFFFSEVLIRNPLLSVIGAWGLVLGVFKRFGRSSEEDPSRSDGHHLMIFAALGSVAGLALLPVAWGQYYLLLVPQIALVGSGFLFSVFAAWLRRPEHSTRVAVAVTGAVLLGLIPSFALLLNQRLRTNEQKRKAIETILDNSSKDETVLDGYSGIGVFRPHAFRYFFFHAEMRQMLTATVIRELEDGLMDGAIAPRFASADSQLAAVSPNVKAFIDQNFAPVGLDPLLIRVFPGGAENWQDNAPRLVGQMLPPKGPFALSIEGWGERQTAGGHSFRRSQGKRSDLLCPVLAPDSIARLVFSARAATNAPGLVATVLLNERELGQMALGVSFASHRMDVPPGFLVRGLNRLEFVYPRRPAQIDPDAGRASENPMDNEVLALESVTFERP